MTRAGRFALVLLSAVGGVACHSDSHVLNKRDGGGDAAGSGGPGTGGSGGPAGSGGPGGGSAPDAAPDATPDASPDAAPNPFDGYRWAALPVPLGARMTALTFDREGVLYAAAEGVVVDGSGLQPGGAGVFKSTDEGASWRPVNLGVFHGSVGALAAVGTTIYAGASSLLRSADGGASWQQVVPVDIDVFGRVSGQGDVVAAASANHLWVSTDAGSTFRSITLRHGGVFNLEVLAMGSVILVSDNNGVVRSTDKGATFNPVQGIVNGLGLSAYLRCDGQRTCYARAWNSGKLGDPSTLLRSTDAGATWTPLSLEGATEVVAISDTGSIYMGGGIGYFARSDDGGATLRLITTPTTAGTFEPNCEGPYVARGDKVFAACPDGVYRSDDKGQHWRSASGSPTTGPITGVAAQMFVDKSPTALGPDGDIYVNGIEGRNPLNQDHYTLKRSSDGGWTWQTVASPFFARSCIATPGGGLECLGVQATSSMNMALARSDDHGATWREVQLPESPDIFGANLATDGSMVYLAGGWFARSIDDGLTFEVIPDGPPVVKLQVLRSGHLLAARFNEPGGHRSTDQGATWQPIARFNVAPVFEDAAGRLIRSIGRGKLEVSTDEAVTWTSLASSGVPDWGDFPAPLAMDGAGHLFVFGPPSLELFIGPHQVSASADGGAHFLPMPAQIPKPIPTGFATDKQGRLFVATVGGVFRLDAAADPGPPRPDGGSSGTPDGGPGAPAPRPLSLVSDSDPWSAVAGIAVDAAQRVYVADDRTVYVIDGSTIRPYLTLAEAATTAGLGTVERILDVDVGPDGKLYILVTSALFDDATRTDTVLTSNVAHQATNLASLSPYSNEQVSVIGAGRVGYYTSSGFWSATATETQNVYAGATLGWANTCVPRDLAISPSGAVAFLPGCSEGAIQRGTVAGAPLQTLYQPNADEAYGERFVCVADDPAGGFYFVVTAMDGKNPRLVHLPDAATGTTAPALVPTEPTLGEISVAHGGVLFRGCMLTVAPNGVIYVQAETLIWKVGL